MAGNPSRMRFHCINPVLHRPKLHPRLRVPDDARGQHHDHLPLLHLLPKNEAKGPSNSGQHTSRPGHCDSRHCQSGVLWGHGLARCGTRHLYCRSGRYSAMPWLLSRSLLMAFSLSSNRGSWPSIISSPWRLSDTRGCSGSYSILWWSVSSASCPAISVPQPACSPPKASHTCSSP